MTTVDLWQQMHHSLQAFILKKTGDESLTSDILQEVYIKMQAKLPELRDETKLSSWLYQISRNTIIDHFRQTQKELQFKKDLPPPLPSAPENELTHRLASWIPFAIEELPEKYRQALYLTEIEGISQKELAERLGISYSGAKSRVQRGREMLKATILACCEVATDKYGNVLNIQKRKKDNCEDC